MTALADFTTQALLDEVKRRTEESEKREPITRWCNGCAHWHFTQSENDERPNCTKLHAMSFRMPEDFPDSSDDWGHYRRNCSDFADRPADALGPNLELPKPPTERTYRRRASAPSARHPDATITRKEPGAIPMLRPMHLRPSPGQRFAVHKRDGLIYNGCRATRVVANNADGIVIYHGKDALDERNAIGWWPA